MQLKKWQMFTEAKGLAELAHSQRLEREEVKAQGRAWVHFEE